MDSFDIRPDETIARIACEDIAPRPDNRELDTLVLQEIAESYERAGQTTPVIVRRLMDGRYELIDGHHRLAAKGIARQRNPHNPAHRSIDCIVRRLTDGEAEMQMLVANIQKSLTIAEKGRLYERIGIHVDELRASDPGRFSGMDRGAAIASCASRGGARVSKATVYRSINAAHAEEGTHEYAGMSLRQRKAVSRMKAGARREAAAVLSEWGSEALDAWIDRIACGEAATEVDAAVRRIYSAASEIRRLEAKGAALNLRAAHLVTAIEEIRSA